MVISAHFPCITLRMGRGWCAVDSIARSKCTKGEGRTGRFATGRRPEGTVFRSSVRFLALLAALHKTATLLSESERSLMRMKNGNPPPSFVRCQKYAFSRSIPSDRFELVTFLQAVWMYSTSRIMLCRGTDAIQSRSGAMWDTRRLKHAQIEGNGGVSIGVSRSSPVGENVAWKVVEAT